MYSPRFDLLARQARASGQIARDVVILDLVQEICVQIDSNLSLLNSIGKCEEVPSLFDFPPQDLSSLMARFASFSVNTTSVTRMDEYMLLMHRMCIQLSCSTNLLQNVVQSVDQVIELMFQRQDVESVFEREFSRFLDDLTKLCSQCDEQRKAYVSMLLVLRRLQSVSGPFPSLFVMLRMIATDVHKCIQHAEVRTIQGKETNTVTLLKNGYFLPSETALSAYNVLLACSDKMRVLQDANQVCGSMWTDELPASVYQEWFLRLLMDRATSWHSAFFQTTEVAIEGDVDQTTEMHSRVPLDGCEENFEDKSGFLLQNDGTYKTTLVFSRLSRFSKESRDAQKDGLNIAILGKLQKASRNALADWMHFLNTLRTRQQLGKNDLQVAEFNQLIDALVMARSRAIKYLDGLIDKSNIVVSRLTLESGSGESNSNVAAAGSKVVSGSEPILSPRSVTSALKKGIHNASLQELPTLPIMTKEPEVNPATLKRLQDKATALGVHINTLRLQEGIDVVADQENDEIPDYSAIDFSYLRLGAQSTRPMNGIPDKLFFSLYSFQLASVDFCVKRRGRCLLGDEMGCGKTLTALACMAMYRDEWPVQIVTPSTQRYNWINELFKWCSEIVDYRNVQLIQSTKDNIHVGLRRGDRSIVICSYNMCTSMMDLFYNADLGMIVVDESHYLKSYSSKRTKSLIPLIRKVPRALLLSGTPMLSRTEEIFTQVHALKPHVFCHFGLFCRRYNAKDQSGLVDSMDNSLQSIKDTLELLEFGIQNDSQDAKLKLYRMELTQYTKAYHEAADKYNSHRAILHEQLNLLREHVVIRRLKRQVVTEQEPKSRSAVNAVLKRDDRSEVNQTYERFFRLMPYLTAYLRMRDLKLLFDVGQDSYEVSKEEEELKNDGDVYDHYGLKEEEGGVRDDNEDEDEDDVPKRDPLEWLSVLEKKLSAGDTELSGREQRRVFMKLYELTGVLKVPFVLEYISDLLDTGKKFVVFAHHKHVMNEICRLLDSKHVSYFKIDGSVSNEDRQRGVQTFQRDSSMRVAVQSITSAGVGLTLTKANLAVFAELYWNPSMQLQAEDRLHRVGQTDPVSVQYQLASHSLDSQIWPRLLQKMEIIGNALDGSTDTGFHKADKQNEAGGLKQDELVKLAGAVHLDNEDDVTEISQTEAERLKQQKKHEFQKKQFFKPHPDCTYSQYKQRGQTTPDQIVEAWTEYNDRMRSNSRHAHTNTVQEEALEFHGRYENSDDKGRSQRFYYHIQRVNAKRKQNYPIGAIPGWFAPVHQRLQTWDSFDPLYEAAQTRLNAQLGIVRSTSNGTVLRTEQEAALIRKHSSQGSTSEQCLMSLQKELRKSERPLRVQEEAWSNPGECLMRATEYLALLRLAWQETSMMSQFETEALINRKLMSTVATNSYHLYILQKYGVKSTSDHLDPHKLELPQCIPLTRYGPKTPLMAQTRDLDRRTELRRFLMYGTCPVYFRDVSHKVSRDLLHSNLLYLVYADKEDYHWAPYRGDMREPTIDLDLQYEVMMQNLVWARENIEDGDVVVNGYCVDVRERLRRWCAENCVAESQMATARAFWLSRGVSKKKVAPCKSQKPRAPGKPGLGAPYEYISYFLFSSTVHRSEEFIVPEKERPDGSSTQFSLFDPKNETYLLPFMSGKEPAMVELCYKTPERTMQYQEQQSELYMQLPTIDDALTQQKIQASLKRRRIENFRESYQNSLEIKKIKVNRTSSSAKDSNSNNTHYDAHRMLSGIKDTFEKKKDFKQQPSKTLPKLVPTQLKHDTPMTYSNSIDLTNDDDE